MRLKQNEIKNYREELLKRQGGVCVLCNLPITSDPVLDHNHVSGLCRAVLHRHCNTIEGKLTNWLKSFGKDVDPSVLFSGLLEYWDRDWTDNPVHPTHRTPEEKQIRTLKKRVKVAKKKETKERLNAKIRELQRLPS
jgi:hypothetical protein